MEDYVLGYKFVPVYRSEFSGMQPASSSTCPISNMCISGAGGRRDVISERAKNLLEKDKFTQTLIQLRLRELTE